MSKINLSVTGQVDMPTIILERKNRDKYGLIKNVVDFSYKENFNAANEISFTVYKELNSKNNNLWEQIVDFRNVFIPEYNELFEIYSDTQEEDGTIYKTVTGKSLGEVELSNVKLYNVEINTENDISNPLYDTNLPTIFYRNPDRWDDPTYISWSTLDKNNPDKYTNLTGKQKYDLLKQSSLLHRIIEKASSYSIGHVDDTLQSLQYVWEYNISGTTVYDELVNTISNDFQCLFIIDSVTKVIDVYDLCNTCDNDECNFYKEHGYRYRGDFNDKCPECGGTHFHGQYGEDTTIFISRENLSSQSSMTTDNTSMKNCFFVRGGDDDINAAIRALNPNGTEYIYIFNEDTFQDMPSELVQKIQSYDALANEYMNNHPYIISQDIAQRYNDVIDYLIEIFGEYHDTNKNGISFKKITYDNSVNQYAIIGHNQLINYIYDSTDLANFLKISMCPTRDTDKQDIDYSIKSIENGFKNDFNNIVGVDTINKSESSIEKIIKNSAKLYYNSGLYNIDVQTQSYIKNTITKQATWTGSIILESYDEFEDEQKTIPVKRTLSVTFTINENYEYYIRQCIAIGVKDMDTKEEYNFLSLDYKGGDEGFSERLHLYSYDELENLLSSFEMLQNIIVESGLDDSSLSEQTKTNYYNIYTSRIEQIQKEITKRDYQLQAVYALYQFDTTNASGILQYYNNDTKTKLNFQNYIGTDLWNTFCSYRREDEYSNENYISTGLNNTQLIARAKELLEFAKKELYKASHPEITISTTVNNLLLLPEFKPLTQYFNLGNWIRVSVDNKIYKLRLLSYQVNYSSISEISVEFSNVREIWNGSYSDIKSIIDSASSITSSYDGIKQQVNKNTNATTVIDEISTVGINGAKMPYISDNKQKIVIDEKGILARRYDDINEVYDENQLKIISNGLYTTNDGWKTSNAGIGKISYYNPFTDEYTNDYGIIAKTIVGNLILGDNMVIGDSSGNVKIDKDGIHLKGGSIDWINNEKIPQSSIDGLDISFKETHEELKEFVNGVKNDLQNQIDSEIISWFYDYEPTLRNKPASDWDTNDLKTKHKNDLFYNTSTGVAYKFLYENGEYIWKAITDASLTNALEKISKAQSTADKKCRTFYSQPTNYDDCDIWVLSCDTTLKNSDNIDVTYNKGTVLVAVIEDGKSRNEFVSSDWIPVTTKSAEKALSDLSDIASDGKITPVEKQQLKLTVEDIKSDKKSIDLQCNSYSITTSNDSTYKTYHDLYNSLISMTDNLLSNINVTSNTPSNFNILFSNYYDALSSMTKVIEDASQKYIEKSTEKIKEDLQNQIDDKIQTFYQSTVPTWDESENTKHIGDLWFNTSTNDVGIYKAQTNYRFNGLIWELNGIVAKDIYDKIDGVASIYDTIPENPQENDILIPNYNFTVQNKTYYKGKIYKFQKVNGSYTWNEVQYSDDTELEVFKEKVNIALVGQNTEIGNDYVISPKIGGGYLYISSEETNGNDIISVEINPKQISFDGHDENYVFNIKKTENNSDNNIVTYTLNATHGILNFYGNIDDANNFMEYIEKAEIRNIPILVEGDSLQKKCYVSIEQYYDYGNNNIFIGINLYDDRYHKNLINYTSFGDTVKIYIVLEEILFGISNIGDCFFKGIVECTAGKIGKNITINDGLKYKNIFEFAENGNYESAVYFGCGMPDFTDSVFLGEDTTIFYVGGRKFEYNDLHEKIYTNDAQGLSIDANGRVHINNCLSDYLSSRELYTLDMRIRDNLLLNNNSKIRLNTNNSDVKDFLLLDSSDNIIIGDNSLNCIINSKNFKIELLSNDNNEFLLKPDQNNKVSLGTTNYKWKDIRTVNIYSNDGTIQISDKNLKKDISCISDAYEKMFNELIPVTYKFKNGTSGRTHIGFISQDVEESMEKSSLSPLDFAGFCKDQKIKEDFIDNEYVTKRMYDDNNNPIYDYSLRYSEFIALNTHMIQKTRQELFETKNELRELKEKLNIALITIDKLTSKS